MGHKTKEARAAYARAYRLKHGARLNAQRHPRRRAEYLKYREKRLAYHKKRRIENRELFLAKERSFREMNRDAINANARRWYSDNHTHNRKCKRNYYWRNRDHARTYQKQYLRSNYDKLHPSLSARTARYRARKLQAASDATATAFIKFVRSQKIITCHYCGTAISGKSAHIDHMLALSKGGSHMASNLCASCPKCNRSKAARPLAEWLSEKQLTVT